jgi:hypothetical protein
MYTCSIHGREGKYKRVAYVEGKGKCIRILFLKFQIKQPLSTHERKSFVTRISFCNIDTNK